MIMNNFLSFQVHGNAESDGIIGLVDDLLAFLTSLSGKSGGDIFAHLMPGIAALDNIHPLLVHFPIAFLLSFFLVDLIASLRKKPHWRELAGWLLYFGTVMALFTVIAGFAAASSVQHGENVHAIMERHQMLGVTTLSLAMVLSAWRLLTKGQIQGEINVLYLILSALLCLVISLGADLGGLMVYQYGVAVKAVSEPATGYFQQHNHNH
jgi:uncharacterized membrane protein